MSERSAHELDIVNGRIFSKYLAFIIPMTLSYMLQLAFNAADIIVVGRFNGSDALAAVGSTSSLVSFIVNFVVGFSNGITVIVARDYAGARYDSVSDSVHTAMAISIIGGILFGAAGIFTARPMLRFMQSPENVIGMSQAYLIAYYVGMPGIVLYNFAAAILRAIGDTKRPMNFLIISGVLNVVLNLFFVLVMDMGVIGVGIATSISNYTSAAMAFFALMKENSCLKIYLSSIRIKAAALAEMLKQGFPVGLQGSIFSISNILIQSAVNGFGSVYMAGNAAAQNIESFQQAFLNANMNTVLTFTSQNVGARKYKRASETIRKTLFWGIEGSLIIGAILALFRFPLLSLYTTEAAVMSVAVRRLVPLLFSNVFGVMMDTAANAIRGFGYSVEPMAVTLLGSCVLRIIWINTIFRAFPYYEVIIIVWPVSWAVTALVHYIFYKKYRKKFPDTDM